MDVLLYYFIQILLIPIDKIFNTHFASYAVIGQYNAIYHTLRHRGAHVDMVTREEGSMLSDCVRINQSYFAITAGHMFVHTVVRLACCPKLKEINSIIFDVAIIFLIKEYEK